MQKYVKNDIFTTLTLKREVQLSVGEKTSMMKNNVTYRSSDLV